MHTVPDFKATLAAIDASIDKWVSVGLRRSTDRGKDNCPLCKLFLENSCNDCPVRAIAEFHYCTNTPYTKWTTHFTTDHGLRYRGNSGYCAQPGCPTCTELCLEEIAFLVDVRQRFILSTQHPSIPVSQKPVKCSSEYQDVRVSLYDGIWKVVPLYRCGKSWMISTGLSLDNFVSYVWKDDNDNIVHVDVLNPIRRVRRDGKTIGEHCTHARFKK